MATTAPATAPSTAPADAPAKAPAAPRTTATAEPRRRRSAVTALLLLAAALLGSLLAGASPAAAHAALTGSDPKQGAVLDSAPKDVTLTFSEGVALSDDSIRVLDPQGKRVDTGKPRDLSRGEVVSYAVGLHSGLPDGTFTVAWQAVSADSHPVSGAFTFSIGAPSKTAVAVPEQETGGGAVGILYGIGRYASYAGFVLLAGGGAFVLACWPRGASVRAVQRLVVQGWAVLTGSTIALLLLRAPYTGSGRLADVLDLGGLRAVLETKPGVALVSRLLLLAAAALFVAVLFGTYARSEDPRQRKDLGFGLGVGGAALAAGTAATWAFAEHASTGLQPGVAMPVDVLHLLAVAAWLGGLAALLVSLYRGPSIERAAVRRFSRLAFGSVLVLAATGLYQSWRQVGSWDALTSTAYGRLLLVKVGLVGLLVGVAWISRHWTARLSADPVPETEAAELVEGVETAELVEVAAEKAGAPETASAPDGASGDDPRRAAQLARQRAAQAAARRKRLRDADPERSGLRRSVLAEAAVAVVLLAVTTALTSTEPARTEVRARAAGGDSAARPAGPVSVTVPFDTSGAGGKGTANIQLDPGTSGGNTLHLVLTRPDGKPLDAPEVKLSFTLESKKLGPLPVEPPRIAAGHWSANGVQLPMPGKWTMSLTVRTSDIDQVTQTRNVKIG
ncbi:copper resistance protein CopC [Streptomyces pathocidini]|uniref:Copper resistance protein CopC n=1 Tax=Streptomyces pathocidini TaxID=1650571 RepID=A0ABW7UPF8_9ACTN|nr:copper resistance protein CopC [Streptomyces pathocidini]